MPFIWSEPEDIGARPLTGGERAVPIVLRVGEYAATAGALVYFAVILRRSDYSAVDGAVAALVYTIPGILLGGLFVPAIPLAGRQQYGRVGLWAGVLALVAAVVGLSYIVSLAGSCAVISGCKQRDAVIYVMALSQFLFLLAWVSALSVAIMAAGILLRRRVEASGRVDVSAIK